MTFEPGSVFAGFRIERRLGAGGMGAVYAARHPRLPRLVALKVLGEGLAAKQEFRARFEREAELAARLDHPNVVSVYDRGVEGDQAWIAMQYVEGHDLLDLINLRSHEISIARAVRIVAEAAKGLDHAHRHGLLHRDVKPANILVAEDPEEGDKVFVTDFGIARAMDETTSLTGTGFAPATLSYASPEQIEGRPLDHRTDIYSLGCTLYVVLTGSLPFPMKTQTSMMHAHLTAPPPRPTIKNPAVPPGLDAVIARALAKNVDERYSTCRELAEAALSAVQTTNALTSGTQPSVPTHSDAPATDLAPRAVPDTEAATSAALAATAKPSDRSAPSVPPPSSVTPNFPPPGPGPSSSSGPSQSDATKNWRKIIAIGVGVAAVIAAAAIGGVALSSGDNKGSSTSSTPFASPAASSAWKTYDFMVAAFPKLLPSTPGGKAYQNAACIPVDLNLEPVGDLGDAVARPIIRCGDGNPVAGAFRYIVSCNRDKIPVALSDAASGLKDTKVQPWTKGSSSGQLAMSSSDIGYGVIAFVFDDPARNFCQVNTIGGPGSTAQDVYDKWFAAAPFG